MLYEGFIAPSGVSRSERMSCERLVNMYLEPLSNNPRALVLYAFPGLQTVLELPSGPVRALYESTTGQVFAVTSTSLFELFAGWTYINRGSVPNGTSVVSVTDDGTYLVLSVEGQGLAYHMTTHALTTIVPGEPTLTFGRVAYLDGRIVTNQPGTRRFWYAELLDPLTWDALSYYSAEARADAIVTLYVDHRELWIFGTQSIEIWTSTGEANNPFARASGTFLEQGIAAPWGVQAMDSTLYWLGGSPRGEGPVWTAQGYSPVRVSSHALESALSTQLTVGNAVASTARHGGHSWYVLWLPDMETTWAYDALTGGWTELCWLAEDGSLERWDPWVHCMGFGVHAWGSSTSGRVYVWNPDFHFYGTRPRYCERTGPFIRDDENGSRITFSNVQLRCLTGQGLDGNPPVGVDPQYRLSWTEDGESWSYEHMRSAGPIGRRERRVTWRQLGQSRERAFRVVSTDPVHHCWRGMSINGA